MMQLVAIERVADLRRNAASRRELPATPRKPRRVKRAPQPRHAPAVAQAEER
jgi:hypothetical protein